MKSSSPASTNPVALREDLRQALLHGGVLDIPEPNANMDEWRVSAASLGYECVLVPCAGAGSKAALLTKFSDILDFPDHFGMNLDALYDCLTDILLAHKKPGMVLMLDGTKTLAASTINPVVDTLLDVAEFMQTKGHRFCVVLR